MEHLKSVVEQLNATLDLMKIEQAELTAKLTPEQRLIVAPIQSDITAALDALKRGDMSELNKLQLKYADTNIK
jgi:hypothetical protein